MKWIHLDEAYTWMPGEANDSTHQAIRKSHPQHYACIPNELFARLNEVWAQLDAVCAEIDKLKGD